MQRNMGKALTSPEEYFKRLQRQNADLHRRLGLRFDPLAPCHLREFEQCATSVGLGGGARRHHGLIFEPWLSRIRGL